MKEALRSLLRRHIRGFRIPAVWVAIGLAVAIAACGSNDVSSATCEDLWPTEFVSEVASTDYRLVESAGDETACTQRFAATTGARIVTGIGPGSIVDLRARQNVAYSQRGVAQPYDVCFDGLISGAEDHSTINVFVVDGANQRSYSVTVTGADGARQIALDIMRLGVCERLEKDSALATVILPDSRGTSQPPAQNGTTSEVSVIPAPSRLDALIDAFEAVHTESEPGMIESVTITPYGVQTGHSSGPQNLEIRSAPTGCGVDAGVRGRVTLVTAPSQEEAASLFVKLREQARRFHVYGTEGEIFEGLGTDNGVQYSFESRYTRHPINGFMIGGDDLALVVLGEEFRVYEDGSHDKVDTYAWHAVGRQLSQVGRSVLIVQHSVNGDELDPEVRGLRGMSPDEAAAQLVADCTLEATRPLSEALGHS